tara:strand:+ start:3471 stop:5876 length:2406 start_codon:yes stop_codon:yes gene_type:complete
MPNYSDNTGYWKFDVKNVFNTVSLSSYALAQTPLKFIPSTNIFDKNFSNYYILWDFGDGSTMQKAFSAEHHYYYPGKYRVTMNLMLSSSEAVLNSYAQEVTIRDFVPNTYAFSTSANPTILTAGEYSDEIKLERFNSLQSYEYVKGYNFYLNLSGSKSDYYDKEKFKKEPYSFLLPTHRFVQRELIGNLYSDTIINKLSTNSILLYGKTLDTNIHGLSSLVVPASADDPNAFFVGTSGHGEFNLVDDTNNTNNSYVFATLDTTNFPDNYTEYYNYPLNDSLPVKNVNSSYIVISRVLYKQPQKFYVTSNGLDGEGFVLPSFNIGNNTGGGAGTKYKESPINFVVKLKYDTDYSVKPEYNELYFDENLSSQTSLVSSDRGAPNYVNLYLVNSNYEIVLNLADTDKVTTNIDYELFKDRRYGFLKGSFTVKESTSLGSQQVALWATSSLRNKDGADISCSCLKSDVQSQFFNIYSSQGVNKVAKINENADMTEILKSYAFQPVIANSPTLWDPFVSTVMGTLSSNTNAIGKRVYEKTSNFIKNNVNLDTCNIFNLFSYANEYNVNLNDYAANNLLINYPADLSQMVNLFSIKKSVLWGRRLQARYNFKDRYNQSTQTIPANNEEAIQYYIDGKTFGNNVGVQLNNESTIEKSENYLVAREIFSDTYKLVNTDIEGLNDTYPLSTFNTTTSAGWGWGLTFPTDLEFGTGGNYTNFYELSDYYQIFRYNNVVPGKYVGNLINWEDIYQTTVDLQGSLRLSATYTPSYLSSFADTPLNSWESSGGIIDQNLSYQLAVGLNLLSATS